METSLTSPALDMESRPAGLNHTLLRLLEAHEDSVQFQEDIWQFAPQLPALRADNIPDRMLRRLVAQGLVAHARETTRAKAIRRSMLPLSNLQFSDQSCFVLTPRGLAVASSLAGKDSLNVNGSYLPAPAIQPAALLPSFVECPDGRRELRLGDAVVKCFKKLAKNQELVLQAFQEQAWPRRILDPIPPKRDLDSKQCLHNTIDRLNRCRLAFLLSFHGDGSGEAVCWAAVVSADRSTIVRR
jgi:hypothetical protein